MKFNRLCPSCLPALLLALVAFLPAVGCTHRTCGGHQPAPPYITPSEPPRDTRRVMVSGKVIGVPAGAQAPQALLSGKILNEDELYKLTGDGSPNRMLVTPKMTVANGDTGRFKLGIQDSAAAIRIELTPAIEADGRVQLNPGIETTDANGQRDSLKDSKLLQPNTGLYAVFGPLKMDDMAVYTILKADVLPQ
jgi:hypothetical protein